MAKRKFGPYCLKGWHDLCRSSVCECYCHEKGEADTLIGVYLPPNEEYNEPEMTVRLWNESFAEYNAENYSDEIYFFVYGLET